jgi:hypothetical protein
VTATQGVVFCVYNTADNIRSRKHESRRIWGGVHDAEFKRARRGGNDRQIARYLERRRTPVGKIVTDLVKRYEKEKFWKEMQEDYSRLRANPVAWKEYQDEAALWDTLSGDGLESEAPYYTAEEEEKLRAEDPLAPTR